MIGVYVTRPNSDTVHIAGTAADRKTFCGRTVEHDWPRGDETINGIAATCVTCKQVLRKRNQLPTETFPWRGVLRFAATNANDRKRCTACGQRIAITDIDGHAYHVHGVTADQARVEPGMTV